MKLGERLEVLEVPMHFGANHSTIHPVLMWDEAGGATLIDTGVPGSEVPIQDHLARLGLGWKDVRRIILTHQDIDHVGGARAAAAASGAEVCAHKDDVPFIQGELPPLKMNPGRVEAMVQSLPPEQRDRVRDIFLHPPTVRVTRELTDGERLPERGGMVVLHTPGHTPGHLSLFLEADRLLIAGDALRVVDGDLVGPLPTATPDMTRAMESVRKLLAFPIDRVLCYHGGLSKPGARERIQQIASG